MPETTEQDVELIPVEAAEELPSDELVDELLPRLTPEQELALASLVTSDSLAALQDRMPWEANLALWDEQYHGILPKKDFPWPGCSNLHVPLTATGVETLKPRLVESILGADQPAIAIPTEPMDEERRDLVELFLNWQLLTEIDLEPLVNESSHLFLIPGTVIAKILWRVEQRKTKTIRHFPIDTDAQAILETVFGVGAKIESAGKLKFEADIPQTGRAPLKATARFKFLEDEIQVLVERDEVTFEGPRPELIQPEDFIAPAKAGTNIQRLPWCQHRLWLSEGDLRRKVKQGRFYKDAVDELLKGVLPTDESAGQDAQAVKAVREETEGIDPGDSNVFAEQFEILEDYRKYDIDDDGWDEEIITWVSPHMPDRILGWDYLDNVCQHGRRPFVRGAFLNEPFKFLGKSFAEVIRGLQEEINTIHNQRVDAGTLQNTPAFTFRASMTMPPGPISIRPGQGIPVDNVQNDFAAIQWNGSPVFGQNEESLLYQYFERLTGLTDLALGRQPNRVGATRTATGVASLLSEAGLRFKTAMQSFQRFWVEIFEHVLALDAQYLPPGKEFRVTGRWPETLRVDNKNDLRGRFDIRLSATTETLNRQVMREDATVKLQTALNPIAMQTGMIGPKGLYRLYRQFFRAYGEAEPDMILEYPKEQIVHTPDEELAIWVNGGDVDPTMLENIPMHVEEHMDVLSNPDKAALRATLGTKGVEKVKKHLAKTLQMMQMQALAMQMQGGKGKDAGADGSAMIGPQKANAEIGAQAPSQPSAFGGGAQQPA